MNCCSPRNFIGQAQSGTGKTATFLLHAFMITQESLKQPQVLVIAPTRELAAQIYDVAVVLGKYTKIRVKRLISAGDYSEEQFGRMI